MAKRLTRWFVFSVVAALLPLGFNSLRLHLKGILPTVEAVVGHGELFLVAACICAAAIGELVGPNRAVGYRGVSRLVAAGGAVVLLALASFCFADVSASYISGEPVQASAVCAVSLWLFLFAVLTSASCVALGMDEL